LARIHLIAQRGTATAEGDVDTLSGYQFDAAAKIDLVELRFHWFDYVLKGGPKPAILADKINYQVTGANVWKHAPSLAAMSNGSLRYYLSDELLGQTHRLSAVPRAAGFIHQTIDFADRRDVELEAPGGGVSGKALDATNGLTFISEPLAQSTELSGLFGGHLDFITNKRDFDFQVALYELTAAQDYIQLAPYWARASYVKDLARHNLLVPGMRQSLDFPGMRLMSRQVAAGSRLVALVSILKEPGREINYGTGNAVIDESIAAATEPLRMTWFAHSYIDIPVHR
jgi:predicted acyl esterase